MSFVKPESTKRAFIYARVSTKQQIEGDGYTRQVDACTAFAEKSGWSVARSPFYEQQTGTDEFADRKQLSTAMDLAGTNSPTGVTAIIVERADRIARDMIVSELFFKECRSRGILVFSADSGEELVNADSDPTRILIRQIICALGQWERTMLIRKMQAGRRRKAMETGRACGAPPAFGDIEVIKEIFRLKDIVGFSYQQIADKFTERRIPTSSGKFHRWRKCSVWFLYKRHKHELGYFELQDEIKQVQVESGSPADGVWTMRRGAPTTDRPCSNPPKDRS